MLPAYLGPGAGLSVSPNSFIGYYYPHFTQQEPETQRPQVICPKVTWLVSDRVSFETRFF